MPRTDVFIGYSRADKKWLDKLRPYLRPLECSSGLIVWDDTQIQPEKIQLAFSNLEAELHELLNPCRPVVHVVA